MEDIEKNSPFRPGKIVSPESFVGRKEEIQRISRYINQASKGVMTHSFISGERGIGKSSLALKVLDTAETDFKMLGLYIVLHGEDNLNDLVKRIIIELLEKTKKEKWYGKIFNFFNAKLSKATIGYNSTKIEFEPKEDELINYVDKFPDILKEITKKIEDEKNGLFIILDDINGLTENPRFADWYKSFEDTAQVKYTENLPVFMMVVGYKEKWDALGKHNESVLRIFRKSDIELLSNYDVRYFFKENFEKLGISVDDGAMGFLVTYSSGMPRMMQEIGDAVFWINEDDTINEQDAVDGILEAKNEIARTYLRSSLDQIQSDYYKSMLNKMGASSQSTYAREDLKRIFDEEEEKKISDFLVRCINLGILSKASFNTYQFSNRMFRLYFVIEGSKLEM
jgi:hypothetical protein